MNESQSTNSLLDSLFCSCSGIIAHVLAALRSRLRLRCLYQRRVRFLRALHRRFPTFHRSRAVHRSCSLLNVAACFYLSSLLSASPLTTKCPKRTACNRRRAECGLNMGPQAAKAPDFIRTDKSLIASANAPPRQRRVKDWITSSPSASSPPSAHRAGALRNHPRCRTRCGQRAGCHPERPQRRRGAWSLPP